jgi:hypothetical protein
MKARGARDAARAVDGGHDVREMEGGTASRKPGSRSHPPRRADAPDRGTSAAPNLIWDLVSVVYPPRREWKRALDSKAARSADEDAKRSFKRAKRALSLFSYIKNIDDYLYIRERVTTSFLQIVKLDAEAALTAS